MNKYELIEKVRVADAGFYSQIKFITLSEINNYCESVPNLYSLISAALGTEVSEIKAKIFAKKISRLDFIEAIQRIPAYLFSYSEQRLQVGDMYQHFKGGIYKIIPAPRSAFSGNLVDSPFGQNLDIVWYQSVETDEVWARTLSEFNGFIEVDGKPEQRFSIIGSQRIAQMIESVERKINNIESCIHLNSFNGKIK